MVCASVVGAPNFPYDGHASAFATQIRQLYCLAFDTRLGHCKLLLYAGHEQVHVKADKQIPYKFSCSF